MAVGWGRRRDGIGMTAECRKRGPAPLSRLHCRHVYLQVQRISRLISYPSIAVVSRPWRSGLPESDSSRASHGARRVRRGRSRWPGERKKPAPEAVPNKQVRAIDGRSDEVFGARRCGQIDTVPIRDSASAWPHRRLNRSVSASKGGCGQLSRLASSIPCSTYRLNDVA